MKKIRALMLYEVEDGKLAGEPLYGAAVEYESLDELGARLTMAAASLHEIVKRHEGGA